MTRAPMNGAPAPDDSTTVSVAAAPDTITQPHRRQCRVCGRPNARPVVPIGSSRHWDLCARCARVVTRRDRERVSALRETGHRLHAGGTVDSGWVAAQLWDLADLLEVRHG